MNSYPFCPLCRSSAVEVILQKKEFFDLERTYWKCQRCCLLFLAPEDRLSWTDEKKRYDCHRNNPDDEGYVRFLKKLAEPLKGKLKSGFQGLDFGCGPGPALASVMSEMGFHLENYDPYYYPDHGLLGRQYDFVTCTEVVEHLRDPHHEFLLLNRLLKDKEGYLGVMTEILEREEDFGRWWYAKDPTHICFYQKSTFVWLADWMGWQVEFPVKNVVIFSKGEIQSACQV